MQFGSLCYDDASPIKRPNDRKPLTMSETDPRYNLARAEWEQLQQVIGRQEGNVFLIRGWLITFLSALIGAYYAKLVHTGPVPVAIGSVVIVLILAIGELIQRGPKRLAIIRGQAIETQLRDSWETIKLTRKYPDGSTAEVEELVFSPKTEEISPQLSISLQHKDLQGNSLTGEKKKYKPGDEAKIKLFWLFYLLAAMLSIGACVAHNLVVKQPKGHAPYVAGTKLEAGPMVSKALKQVPYLTEKANTAYSLQQLTFDPNKNSFTMTVQEVLPPGSTATPLQHTVTVYPDGYVAGFAR